MSTRFRQSVREYTRAVEVVLRLGELTDEEKQQLEAMVQRVSKAMKDQAT